MTKELIKGNYAIAQAALNAGCECYFGYPITPQTEIGEYLSLKMPEAGLAYVSAESEVAAINMVLGACSTGARAMTTSSSCAVSLMQEALSYAASDELPVVLVNVMRAGPGLGSIYPAQGDYYQSVYGGGNGDYRMVVYAPSNVQECIELTYKAFYTAHKYRTPVILLADGVLGQMMEPAEFTQYPYPSVDNSSWALTGAKGRAGKKICSYGPDEAKHIQHVKDLFEKYKLISEREVMYEEYMTEDADFLLVGFGSLARHIKASVKELRSKGIRAGMFRPITLFPFPEKRLSELAGQCKEVMTVEMNMGQMFTDVRLAVNGKTKTTLLNLRPAGEWMSVDEITDAVEKSREKVYAGI